MVSNISIAVGILQAAQTGGFDYSFLAPSGSGSAGGQIFSAGNVHVALAQAEANEHKQLEQLRKSPTVQRELARYAEVVAKAETLDDILDDPIARKVLLKASGLGDQTNFVGLAKKALASDPADLESLAHQLSGVNGAWLEFANKYNVHAFGLERLKSDLDGINGKWEFQVARDGVPTSIEVDISTFNGVPQATIDGLPAPFEINGDEISLNILWEDADENLRTSIFEGTLKDGRMSGVQFDSGQETGGWTAAPFYAGAVSEIEQNYLGELRLDQLDEQLPGLGSAVLFKRLAPTLDTTTKVLGSALGREVVTTALGLPRELALQSLVAQEKAIDQRIDVAKLQDPEYVDRIVQRYLLQLNGGQTGVTA